MMVDLPDGYDRYGGRERTHVVRLADAAADGINDWTLCGQPCVPRFGPSGFRVCATCARLLEHARAQAELARADSVAR